MTNHNEYTSNAFIIKDFLSKVFALKYLYAASLIIFVALAFMINRFSPTVYEVNSVIGPMVNARSVLQGSNNLFSGLEALEQQNNLENDINNAKSFTLVAATLNKMDLEVGYFRKESGLFGKSNQMYPNTPFTVSIDKSHVQPINTQFKIEIIDRNTYRLTASNNEASLYNYIDNRIVSEENNVEIDTLCRFNQTISNRYFKFVVSLNSGFNLARSVKMKCIILSFIILMIWPAIILIGSK
jgi:tyrosine-protein kinase Etk/Wzc